jgi:hypothetical protein
MSNRLVSRQLWNTNLMASATRLKVPFPSVQPSDHWKYFLERLSLHSARVSAF